MMMEKKLSRSLRLICASGMLAGVGLNATPAMAQQAEANAPLQRVEITGSNIRRADKETPSPVQVITAEELQKSGFSSVSDVLRNLTANGQGTVSQANNNGFSPGASGIALRGLTVGATLVLIDGHRMAPYPLYDDGQRAYVDISNIPFDAVERIEILKDGASATYGSDAIAGVVNVILKKSYVGTRAAAEIGIATEKGGRTEHASLTHGFGDYDTDGFNAFGTIEVRKQERITIQQRDGKGDWTRTNWSDVGGLDNRRGVINPFVANPVTQTPYLVRPGARGSAANTVFFPGTCNYALRASGGCAFQSPDAEIQPSTSNMNLLGSFSKKLAGDWKLNLQGSFFESKAETVSGFDRTFPGNFSQRVAVSAGVEPYLVGTTQPVRVPANYPGNTLGVPARLYGIIPDIGPIRTGIDSQTTRLVANVGGTWGDWDINSALGYTKVNNRTNASGNILVPEFNAALNRPVNPYRITGGNTEADLATLFPVLKTKSTSEVDFFELRGARSIAKLAGGDLGISVGTTVTHTILDARAADLVAQGKIAGFNAFASGQQSDAAVFAEVVAPVLKSLELDGSVRYDRISGGLNSTTPKVGFKFSPIREATLRGTYSKGFRAPNPAEIGDAGQLYGLGTSTDTVLCPDGSPRTAGNVIAACSYQATQLNRSNPKLKPEKSDSFTAGLILEPVRGWSTTLDYFSIKIKDQIVLAAPSPDAVRGAPTESTISDGAGGTFLGTPAFGPVIYFPSTYENASSTKVKGVELGTSYKFKQASYGSLTAAAQFTHMMSYVLTVDGTRYQLAGTHGPSGTSGNTGNPKDRATVNLTWDNGPLQLSTTVNYISSFDLTDPSVGTNDCSAGAAYGSYFPDGNPPSNLCRVAAFVSTDLSGRYKLNKGWTIHGSVTNLFNRQPPVDLNTYGNAQLPYNPSLHSVGAVGRFVNVGASYEF